MSESVLFTVNILNQKFSLILINKFLWRHTIGLFLKIYSLFFILLFLRKWTLTLYNLKVNNVSLKFW